MSNDDAKLWLNYDAAMDAVSELKEIGLRQFVMRGVTVATTRVAYDRPAATPCDLLFLVQVLVELYQQKSSLIKIMSGEDLRWWSDDGAATSLAQRTSSDPKLTLPVLAGTPLERPSVGWHTFGVTQSLCPEPRPAEPDGQGRCRWAATEHGPAGASRRCRAERSWHPTA